jgi:hypothetical protein
MEGHLDPVLLQKRKVLKDTISATAHFQTVDQKSYLHRFLLRFDKPPILAAEA